MKQNKLLLTLTLLSLCIITGCNLFSFTNPTNSSTDYISDGQKKYWDGDFNGAVSDFSSAIGADPNDGDAYWWHAKALLRATGYSAITLITTLSDLDTQDNALPFMDWSADSANVLYGALFGINDDLNMIYYDSVSCEELDADAVALDYASSLALHGVLMLRDTNVDSVISEPPDINFGAFFQNGEFVIPADLWNDLTPDEQNALLDNVIYILENFSNVTEFIIEDMEIEGIDIVELDETVDAILETLNNLRP